MASTELAFSWLLQRLQYEFGRAVESCVEQKLRLMNSLNATRNPVWNMFLALGWRLCGVRELLFIETFCRQDNDNVLLSFYLVSTLPAGLRKQFAFCTSRACAKWFELLLTQMNYGFAFILAGVTACANDSHLYCAAVVKTENQTLSLARLVPDWRRLYGNHACSMVLCLPSDYVSGRVRTLHRIRQGSNSEYSECVLRNCSRIARLSPAPPPEHSVQHVLFRL